MTVTFRIDGIPVAQPRQRMAVVAGRAMNFTPKKHPVNEFKAVVRIAAGAAIPEPMDGPVKMSVIFVLPRPKSMVWKSRPMPRVWCPKKPDVDNLFKALADGMAGCWRDDSQICYTTIEKWYARGDEQPHVQVTVETLAGKGT